MVIHTRGFHLKQGVHKKQGVHIPVKTGEPGGTREIHQYHHAYIGHIGKIQLLGFFSVPFNNFVLILDMLFYHI